MSRWERWLWNGWLLEERIQQCVRKSWIKVFEHLFFVCFCEVYFDVEIGPDPTRAYIWPAVNKGLTHLWHGIFWRDNIFLIRGEKFGTFSRNFPNPEVADPTQLGPKSFGPDPALIWCIKGHFWSRFYAFGKLECLRLNHSQLEWYCDLKRWAQREESKLQTQRWSSKLFVGKTAPLRAYL